jgi:hypothetical protein
MITKYFWEFLTLIVAVKTGTVGVPLKAPRSSGVNGAKSCILGISWLINVGFK